MEKRTMADIRREKFNKQGQIARELADLALREIDEALTDHAQTRPDIPPGQIGGVLIRANFMRDIPPDDAA